MKPPGRRAVALAPVLRAKKGPAGDAAPAKNSFSKVGCYFGVVQKSVADAGKNAEKMGC
jgi:hypothetical protein